MTVGGAGDDGDGARVVPRAGRCGDADGRRQHRGARDQRTHADASVPRREVHLRTLPHDTSVTALHEQRIRAE